MINFVEFLADEKDQEQSPCKYGNAVLGHACYCHHPDGPRKCHLYWGGVDEMEKCEMFESAVSNAEQ